MDYWVQTNEDMNPVLVNNVSDPEMQGIVKLLESLAAEGELVELSDSVGNTIYGNYDQWRSVNSSKRTFTKYSSGYVKASDDILSYGKCIGYGVDYRNMHTAIHGILVFSDSDEAEQAYAELKQAEHTNDEQEYNDILSHVFDFAVEDIDEINFRDFINVGGDKIYPRYDDEFIIIVNDFAVDLYV